VVVTETPASDPGFMESASNSDADEATNKMAQDIVEKAEAAGLLSATPLSFARSTLSPRCRSRGCLILR